MASPRKRLAIREPINLRETSVSFLVLKKNFDATLKKLDEEKARSKKLGRCLALPATIALFSQNNNNNNNNNSSIFYHFLPLLHSFPLSLSLSRSPEQRIEAYQARVDFLEGESLGLQMASDQMNKKLTKLAAKVTKERIEAAALKRRHQALITKIQQLPADQADKVFPSMKTPI